MGRVDLQRPLAFLSVGRRVVNEDFDRDLKDEPERIRNFYRVRGRPRVEPVGLVYLWPETG